jgi:hypothetical protein
MQNAARYLAKDELGITDVHGVPGVRTALIPNDPIGALGEHVDELSLSFVSPLGADDDDCTRVGVEHGFLSRPAQKNAPAWAGR